MFGYILHEWINEAMEIYHDGKHTIFYHVLLWISFKHVLKSVVQRHVKYFKANFDHVKEEKMMVDMREV